MYELLDELTERICSRNNFQRNILENKSISENEKKQLERFLQFNTLYRHKAIEELVDAYLFVIDMSWEETRFFVENGRYRNSTYEEVGDSVYANHDYMEKYMMGLSILDYLMISHLKMIRYFEDNVVNWGGRYLEIGPGAGQLLVTAIEKGRFESFTACDISDASIELSNDYLDYLGWSDKCKVEKKDFFEYSSNDKFDCIVMGEVLEHVERPDTMLGKIHELLSDDGVAYITTVINTPTIDHIYMFSDKDQVLDMVRQAGFCIEDYLLATAGDIPLEKAIRKKRAINIAMMMRKC